MMPTANAAGHSSSHTANEWPTGASPGRRSMVTQSARSVKRSVMWVRSSKPSRQP